MSTWSNQRSCETCVHWANAVARCRHPVEVQKIAAGWPDKTVPRWYLCHRWEGAEGRQRADHDHPGGGPGMTLPELPAARYSEPGQSTYAAYVWAAMGYLGELHRHGPRDLRTMGAKRSYETKRARYCDKLARMGLPDRKPIRTYKGE